ncbi:MAG: DEAD/DEAH box helicase [Lentimicrobiaceae bacterium]|jgi:superfamily II DNA/RNA helicase|nr:DEAD/DEAH box helicase [Lentimicrobiaceae bacterium]MBT3454793.1 DEAD/DEAH box helicase [Lentimicrobiaceae bacterium]MBT3819603.1 DEAD/DEAH box helicase [Lentimicrobiaceae bacterium]MBT4061319.1 DEAD/DEAH box helicase [Lentimicrobiaceae bacterium]MBT4191516.1 DEAD/DEAH box helicase [Lentimicrobiaceae bacterium]
MTFKELGLNEQMLEAISFMGFDKATPVQELAIPAILRGDDLIACAQTGTGKTAAFVLPVLNNLTADHKHETSVLIIVPTRELAIQIDQAIQGFTYFTPVESIPVYGGGGGSDWDTEKKALTSGADIIVATPGRLISHLNMGYVKFDSIKHLILDEADRMLDIGFYDDILKIIKYLPKKKQTLMFSATMPSKIKHLASKILINPKEVTIEISKPAEGVLQAAYLVYDTQKTPLITSLVKDKPDLKSILIFTSTKLKVNEIVNGLRKTEKNIHGISSALEQAKREEVLSQYRAKNTRILVATDVLSRGIDIKDIDLVINYDVPNDAEDYVHRIGRTARAKSTGIALTLVNEDDMFKFKRIEDLIENEVTKIPLPIDLGDGPEWNVRENFKKKFNNKGHKRKNFNPKFNKKKNN